MRDRVKQRQDLRDPDWVDMIYGRKFPAHQSQETDRQDVSSDMPLTSSVVKGSTEDMRHNYKNELPYTYQHPIG